MSQPFLFNKQLRRVSVFMIQPQKDLDFHLCYSKKLDLSKLSIVFMSGPNGTGNLISKKFVGIRLIMNISVFISQVFVVCRWSEAQT